MQISLDSLASGDASNPDSREPLESGNFEGGVFGIFGNKLIGFIQDKADPENPVEVEILGSGAFYTRTIANALLTESSMPDGQCGIIVSLPPELMEGGGAVLTVIVANTLHALRPAGANRKLLEYWLASRSDELRRLQVHRLCWLLTGRAANAADLNDGVKILERDGVNGACALAYHFSGYQPLAVHSRARPALEDQKGDPVKFSQDETDDAGYTIDQLVASVYQAVLKRDPEPEGYRIYGDAFRNGLPLRDFIEEFLRLAEFRDAWGIVPSAEGASVRTSMTELARLSASMERAVVSLAMGVAASSDRGKPLLLHPNDASQQKLVAEGTKPVLPVLRGRRGKVT